MVVITKYANKIYTSKISISSKDLLDKRYSLKIKDLNFSSNYFFNTAKKAS